MGTVYATITIKNQFDVRDALHGYIKDGNIRQAQVEAVVDTGAPTLFITEELRGQLGLEIVAEWPVTTANGAEVIAKRTEGVEVHWKDRSMICRPYVLPGGKETLLGCIPLEDMDLIVDPLKEMLVGAHGDKILHRAVGFQLR